MPLSFSLKPMRDNSSRVALSRSRFTCSCGFGLASVSIVRQPNEAHGRWQNCSAAYLSGELLGISYWETGYLKPHGDDSMTRTASIEERLATIGVVPLVQADDPETALHISEALLAGGLSVIEVVLRTDEALTCLKAVSESLSEAIV